jgi:hypothetical protein
VPRPPDTAPLILPTNDPAADPERIRPDTRRTLAVALGLGLLVGVGAAVALDSRRP